MKLEQDVNLREHWGWGKRSKKLKIGQQKQNSQQKGWKIVKILFHKAEGKRQRDGN